MKLAIIGTNPEYFNFLECDIVEDYNQADIIIFSGTFNYRSAATKFNRIPSNKLVISVGEPACDFLHKRYESNIINCAWKAGYQSCIITSTSLTFIHDVQAHEAFEGVIEGGCLYRPSCMYKCLAFTSLVNIYLFKGLSGPNQEFLTKNSVPIIMELQKPNKPRYLSIQLNPKFIALTSINNYIKDLICKYKDLL